MVCLKATGALGSYWQKFKMIQQDGNQNELTYSLFNTVLETGSTKVYGIIAASH